MRDAYNAVFVESEAAGQLMFYGRGAGGAPTASAVLGDLVAVGRNRLSGGRGPGESAYADLPVRPIGEAETRYYIALDVADKAGVLATVAQTFASHDVSIETLRQDGHGDDATLVIVTHRAGEAQLSGVVDELRGLDVVRAVTSVLRVEGERIRHDRSRHVDGRTHPHVAWRHRGVPRPAPGRRRHPGRHAARGRHAAGPRARSSPG